MPASMDRLNLKDVTEGMIGMGQILFDNTENVSKTELQTKYQEKSHPMTIFDWIKD